MFSHKIKTPAFVGLKMRDTEKDEQRKTVSN